MQLGASRQTDISESLYDDSHCSDWLQSMWTPETALGMLKDIPFIMFLVKDRSWLILEHSNTNVPRPDSEAHYVSPLPTLKRKTTFGVMVSTAMNPTGS